MSDTLSTINGEPVTADGPAPVPEPPPLVAFDTNGHAAVINYALPEPMSYPGRRLVDLGFRGSDFADFRADGGPALRNRAEVAALVAAASPADAVSAPAAVVLTPSTDGTPVVDERVAPFPVGARLKRLTWDAVEAIADAGKRVEIYRSIGGDLDYRVREANGTPARPGLAARRKDDDSGPLDPLESPYVTLAFLSPTAPSTAVTGPTKLTVTARADWYRTSQPTVSLKLDDAAPVAATMAPDGT